MAWEEKKQISDAATNTNRRNNHTRSQQQPQKEKKRKNKNKKNKDSSNRNNTQERRQTNKRALSVLRTALQGLKNPFVLRHASGRGCGGKKTSRTRSAP